MSSPTPLVEQGNSIEGYLPRGRCEMLIAGATYAIWEAIHAFPEGSTKREWDEWVEHMSKVAVLEDSPYSFSCVILIYPSLERCP